MKLPRRSLASARQLVLLALCLAVLSASGQGWVNFINSPATLFSVRHADGSDVGLNGTYYFSLLTAPVGTSDPRQFSFSGLYATNLAVAGRFSGGTYVPVPKWAVGASEAFLIAGWSASLGPDWDQVWLDGDFARPGFFGLSEVGSGIAGGIFDTNKPPLPPLNLFGGTTGLQTGFSLYPVGVPEPGLASLCLLGMGVALVWGSKLRLRLPRPGKIPR